MDEEFEEIEEEVVEENDHTPEHAIEEEEEEEIEEDEEEDSPAPMTGYRSSFGKVDVWDKKHTQETRFYEIESRLTNKNGQDVVVGHAAVFNSLSEDLGGFREKIMPGAFDDVLKNDVRAYFNHDPNFLLGRTSAGTLRLSVDEKGLRYELDVPNTTAGRDLKENLRLGNITQSSFAFTIGRDGDSWERNEDGADIRIINKVNRLYDVSPVSLPAYPSANDLALAQRSNFLDKEKTRKEEEQNYESNSLLNLKINLLKRKVK
jgi:HK97 family phage prohead protease